MPQTWNPETYARDGAFVPELGAGVLEWLAAQPGERILDLGCGDGQLTQRIAATGANVTAIDASPAWWPRHAHAASPQITVPQKFSPMPMLPLKQYSRMPPSIGFAGRTR